MNSRFSVIFLILSLGITCPLSSLDNNLDNEADLQNLLLSYETSDKKYTISYYENFLSSERPADLLLAHIGKSIRLIQTDVNLSTEEIILAKEILFRHPELQRFRSYLDFAECMVYTSIGNVVNAGKIMDRLKSDSKGSDNPFIQAYTNLLGGLFSFRKGEYDSSYVISNQILEAIDHVDFADDLTKAKFRLKTLSLKSTSLLGLLEVNPGLKDEAKAIVADLISKADQAEIESVKFNAIGNLSYIYYLEGDYERMLPLSRQDLDYSTEIGQLESVTMLHIYMGSAYLELGRTDSAEYHLGEVEKLIEYLKIPAAIQEYLEFSWKFYEQTDRMDEGFKTLYRNYDALRTIYKSNSVTDFNLLKAEKDLEMAQERIESLDRENNKNILISLLLGLLSFSFAFIAFNFIRSARVQKKYRIQLEEVNRHLEEEVRKRTRKIVRQNEQIKEFAYHNSHKTRAPVANLLGFVRMLKLRDNEDNEKVIEYIIDSAQKVDEIILEMNKVLSESDNK